MNMNMVHNEATGTLPLLSVSVNRLKLHYTVLWTIPPGAAWPVDHLHGAGESGEEPDQEPGAPCRPRQVSREHRLAQGCLPCSGSARIHIIQKPPRSGSAWKFTCIHYYLPVTVKSKFNLIFVFILKSGSKWRKVLTRIRIRIIIDADPKNCFFRR